MKVEFKKKILKAGKWVIIGYFFRVITQLLISVLFVRLLSPDTLSDIYLLNSIISFGVIFSSFGIANTLLRTVSYWIKNDEITVIKKWFKKVLILMLCSTFLTSFIFLLSLPLLFENFLVTEYLNPYALIIILWLEAVVLQTLMRSWVLAFQNQKAISLYIEILPQGLILSALLIGAAIKVQFELYNIAALMFFVSFMSGALLYNQYKKYIKGLNHIQIKTLNGGVGKLKSDEHMTYKSLFKVAFPLWVIGIMLFVLTRFDIWIIGNMLSSQEVAVYGTLLKLTFTLGVIFSIFNSVIAPLISEIYLKNELKRLEEIIRSAATFSAIPALIFTLLLLFFGGDILRILFGEYFVKGETALQILTVGISINILTGCSGTLLMYTDYQKIMMTITICSGLLTILLSYLLIIPYGIEGVAFASSSGMVFQNIFMFYYARKKVGIKTHFNLKYLKKDNLIILLKSRNA